jgi:hypothetical protein
MAGPHVAAVEFCSPTGDGKTKLSIEVLLLSCGLHGNAIRSRLSSLNMEGSLIILFEEALDKLVLDSFEAVKIES